MYEKIGRYESLSFPAFFLLLVLLRFRVDHGARGCVDADFFDIPVGAEDLDFPDCRTMFLFEFRVSSSRLLEKSLFSSARPEA
jgi:hypothetical protein